MKIAESGSADLLMALKALCLDAGTAILKLYANGDGAVVLKPDMSPVTAADHESERIILAGLSRLTPDIPIVSEERVAAGDVPDISGDRFWLVDPLDGTREFIDGNGEFTVNIALIENNAPALGAVYAPVLSTLYLGRVGEAAWRATGAEVEETIRARPAPPEGLTVVASRSHGDREALTKYLHGYRVASERQAGSSLKFCLLAEGSADLYPRFGRTMEWDTAAGEAVLRAAGGSVEALDGQPLFYGKPGLDNQAFVAFGRR